MLPALAFRIHAWEFCELRPRRKRSDVSRRVQAVSGSAKLGLKWQPISGGHAQLPPATGKDSGPAERHSSEDELSGHSADLVSPRQGPMNGRCGALRCENRIRTRRARAHP